MFARRSHRKLVTAPRVVLAAAVMFAAVPAYFAVPASAAAGDLTGFTVQKDLGGPNDIHPDQVDLTQMGTKVSPGVLQIEWGWSATSWSGGNKGDACALFDTNGNGNIDVAVCAEVASAGATVVLTGAPTVWSCADTKNDRCSNPNTQTGVGVGGVVNSGPPPVPGNLITSTDPFTLGGANTTVEVDVPSAVASPGALLNVCSYPSIGGGGNANPFDCIVTPAATASVTATKVVTGTGAGHLGPFKVSIDCGVGHQTLDQAFNVGTDVTLTGIPDKTSCTVTEGDKNGAATTTYAVGAGAAGNSAPTFNADATTPTTVTITNDFPVAATVSVTAHKVVSGVGAGSAGPFAVSIDCGAGHQALNQSFNVGTDVTLSGIPSGTSCTVTETNSSGATTKSYAVGAAAATSTAPTFSATTNTTVTITNTYTPIVIIPGNAVLGVTKSSVPASGSFVKPGDSIVYTLAYNNTGNAVATGVTLTDALPADLDYVAGTATAPGQYDSATRTLSWALGNLPVGANGTVSFTAQVAKTATNGEVLHNVGVINAPGISDPSNADDVTVTVPTGALTLTKAVDKTSANYGDTVAYTLVASATGQVDQTNVKVNDGVPTGTTYVDNSASCASPCTASEAGGTVTWNVGTLAAGSSATLTFKVTIDKPAAAADGSLPTETVNNSGTAGSDQDPSVASNQVSTTVVEVLGVKVTRKPTVKGEKQTRLPFTGMPFPLWQVLGVSLAMLMLGSALSFGMRQPRPVEEPRWRDS